MRTCERVWNADPSPFHEGTATLCYCATVSCWWHFPIDLDESCQDRVSAPRAEAFFARRNVRWPGSARCPRRRRRSFAFSQGPRPHAVFHARASARERQCGGAGVSRRLLKLA